MRWRLRNLLSLQIAAIAALPLAAIVIFALAWMLPQMRDEIEARQQAVAYTLAGQVEIYLTGTLHKLTAISALLRHAPPRDVTGAQRLLDLYVGAGEAFENITLLDARGLALAVGLPQPMHRQRATLLAADFSRRPFFQAVRTQGRPVWSDTFLSVISGRLSVALALPLDERVLVGEIALEELSRFISATAERAAATAMIVDAAGSLVAHPRADLTGRQISLRNLPVVADGLAGRSVVREFDLDGEPLIGMSVPVPQIGWLVLVAQSRADAFRQLYLAGRVIAAALFVALLAAAAAGLRLSYTQARRIAHYSQNARNLAGGEYSLSWPGEHVREFSELADNLKQMAEAIRSREQALRTSEERLRATLDNTPGVAVQWFDRTGRVLYWNRGSERLYAIPATEAVGKTMRELLHTPEQFREFLAFIAAIARDGRPYGPAEIDIRSIHGAEVSVLYTMFMIPGGGGGDPIFVCMDVDITERKRAEERLRASEAQLAEAQRLAHIGSWELVPATNRLTWSEEIYRIFEIDPASGPGTYESFLAAVHPEDRERVHRAYTGSVADRTPYDIVHRLLMADGRVKYVHELCNTTYSPEGAALRSLGTVQDITELKIAERKLQEYREHLEELVDERTSQVREQARILDEIHDSVVTTDLAGVVTGWNKGAERLFGYTAAEAIGRHIGFAYPPGEQDFLRERVIAPLLARGEHEIEVRTQRKSGELFHAHLSLSMLHDGSGRATGMVGYSLDITARKQAEALAGRHAEELAAANRELEAFSYSVSHDLRAPLRAVNGFAQALAEEYGDRLDDAGRDHLDRIRRGTARMDALIDDLLTLSRVGRSDMQPGEVDLTALAREIAAELELAGPGRQVVFEIEPGLSAHGDARLLRIVLGNLLDNAWKYTGPVEAARIVVGRERVARQTVFFVRDNGVGFDMRFADKLFGAFQRLHGTEFPGSGIGLATVQRIVRRHGGRVWAEAEPGKGATLYFTLDGQDRV